MSRVVTASSELPLAARTAFTLAQRIETFRFVTRGPLRFTRLPDDVAFGRGATFSARMWFFGVVPAWQHHGEVVDLNEAGPVYEIHTQEHGGPVTTWNHHLTFTPVTPGTCRYTDRIEIDDALTNGFLTAAFANAFFRYRHSRWRTLATVLAGVDVS